MVFYGCFVISLWFLLVLIGSCVFCCLVYLSGFSLLLLVLCIFRGCCSLKAVHGCSWLCLVVLSYSSQFLVGLVQVCDLLTFFYPVWVLVDFSLLGK